MPDTPTNPMDEHVLRVQKLFVRHQQAILGYILAIEPNLSDAQDIVQEVFGVVCKKANAWTDGSHFLAWVCTIARYSTLHFQRTRAQRILRLDDDVVELLYGEDLPKEGELQEHVGLLKGCLNKLAPRAREVVWLRYHNDQKPGQIASDMRCAPDAVIATLARARTFLRECLEHQIASVQSR